MSALVKLASLDELPPGSALEVEHDGRIIALFHDDDGIHAIDGICPHQGGPLANGERKGSIVTCPWHGWQFDVRDGRCLLHRRVHQDTYDVTIDGRDVLVQIP